MKEKPQSATEPKTISISAKCSDLCSATLIDGNGAVIAEYDGYVPDLMPGEHCGDYVMLDIDLATGRILNWKAPTAGTIAAFVAKCKKVMKQKPIKTVASADEARQLAIDWQHWMSEQNLSYGELHEWQCYFKELATKFNLTEEFKENAVI